MYELAPKEVVDLAHAMIEKDHPHLLDANITYLFREEAWKSGDGRTILGKAAKRNEIDRVLSQRQEDFIIILVKPRWDKMNEEERRCLVDHELCHCGVMVTNSGEKKWKLRKHPIEEFPENLARFAFRRDQMGVLIENPPSAVVTKPVPSRKIRPKTAVN
jgi:predicted TIM-barrel fold metal-dependent hydrolase